VTDPLHVGRHSAQPDAEVASSAPSAQFDASRDQSAGRVFDDRQDFGQRTARLPIAAASAAHRPETSQEAGNAVNPASPVPQASGTVTTQSVHPQRPTDALRQPVSVVICAYTDRRLQTLRAAIAAVGEQLRAGDELLVVVDHNPELQETLNAAVPGVRVLPNEHATPESQPPAAS
jgi:hypothetical protein